MELSPALVAALPKVALHDHLDGGLRPGTVLELSRELGLEVPGLEDPAGATRAADGSDGAQPVGDAEDVRKVADWFHAAADSGSLPEYLSTFEHTVALMQTAPQLRRIAREFVEDMVADGVVYAETRWGPHQHTAGGLSLDEAVQAVQDGLDEGVAAAAESGRRIVVGQLLCYLRHREPTEDLVDIAIARRGTGVLGLDLAGPEAGFPASWFRAQFERAREHGVRVTIHAGEAEGPSSIADALDCGAERIGHGVRLLEDLEEETGPASPQLGHTAARVHEAQICLEVCPSSNLQTGAAADYPSHPVGPLHRLGFAIALSSDNRLMSRTRTSREMLLVAQTFDWSLTDLEQVVLTGLDAGFAPTEQRQALRDEVVLPAFRAVHEADQHQAEHPDPGAGPNPDEKLEI
ncbi:adenosine deaminase [Brachybacterium avium]|uniref:adenosine deaminase n=1 Tax=Brachybacterium avium TaxID=2017485 RepID=A0A220UBS4_9MICO|nr:adenosine deaminase [Brachybacterium avium]ASK65567.1 adenosine deaminase [Brachybacterium avium]